MKFCGRGSGGGRFFQKAPSPGYALHILQHPGHPAEDTPRAVLREQRHAGMGGLFRPQDETVMIAVEEQALKRHALMRHVYGVHFAGNGVRTRSIHPDISPAADQRGKRIRFDMKHERLRIDIGLRQGILPEVCKSGAGCPSSYAHCVE